MAPRRILIAFLWMITLSAHSVAYDEQMLKSVVIYKLSLFVTWPDPPKNFLICTFSDQQMVVFQKNIAHQKRKGALIQLKKVAVKEQNFSLCHILSFEGLPPEEAQNLLSSMQDKSILTIGHGDHFAKNGGMIGLFLKDGRVKFSINYTASKKAGLSISAKVLPLATEVY